MDLTPSQAELLLTIRQQRKRSVADDPNLLPPGESGLSFNARLRARYRAAMALDGMVPASLPSILGRSLSGAESKLYGRAAVALEDSCLIRRHIGPSGKRMMYLELTERGEKLAGEIEQRQAADPIGN